MMLSRFRRRPEANPTQLIQDRVAVELIDTTAVVALSRPDKFNGLDIPMMEALLQAAKWAKGRREIRAIIIRGEGPAFCAGLDFASAMKRPGKLLAGFIPWGRKANLFQRLCLIWRDLPVPVIAATHGFCFGGGLQLALGCDFRISDPDCEFSAMEIDWGLIPDMGASVTLRELMATDQVLELTMTGRRIPASEALKLHLITRIEDDPLAAATQLANSFAERSPDAIAASKRLFQRTRVMSERRALMQERRLQLGLFLGKNQREAMRAKLEKRRPDFKKNTL